MWNDGDRIKRVASRTKGEKIGKGEQLNFVLYRSFGWCILPCNNMQGVYFLNEKTRKSSSSRSSSSSSGSTCTDLPETVSFLTAIAAASIHLGMGA